MNQLVIDIHDAARLTLPADVGVAERLRLIANSLNDLVREMRALLVSDADSKWGEFR